MLLDSLAEGTVRWGHKVSDVRGLGGGRHEVTFADGSTGVTSLLVGADGAWSRVRPVLSDAAPAYAGASFVETWLPDADIRHPVCCEDGRWRVDVRGLYGQEADRGSAGEGRNLHVYAMISEPRDRFDGIDFTDRDAATKRIAREFNGWAPDLTALISDGDTTPVLRPLYSLPVGHRWDRVPGVTLVGDAAHLNPPNSEGANLAMLDGAELGEALATHPDHVETALAELSRRCSFAAPSSSRLPRTPTTPRSMT